MVLLNCFSFLMEANIVVRNFSKVLSEIHGRVVQSRRRCGLPTLRSLWRSRTIPDFAALKAEFADIRGGRRGWQLEPLAGPCCGSGLRRQLTDLLARGCIQHKTAGHAALVVFARKPDGSWRIRVRLLLLP